jgi:hypothetical protein
LNVAAPFPVPGIGAVFFMEDFLNMKCGKTMCSILPVLLCLSIVAGVIFTPLAWAETGDSLLRDVVKLDLGLQGYVIGKKLNPDQKKIAAKHVTGGAYTGTYKFVDNDLYVVVDKKTDRILALYKKKKDADKTQLKAMIAELMDRFDAPTTMAHDKLIYWAFNKHGSVSEDDFTTAKKIQQTAKLGIIATVKLNSELEIAPDSREGDQKKSSQGKTAEQAPATGTIYFIITSDPLVKAFIAEHQ